jgi:solute carrier family 25 2-oxodicarboxylate transporter 21
VPRPGRLRSARRRFEAIYDKPAGAGSPGERAVAGAVCTVPEALTIMPLELAKVALQLDTTNRFRGSSRRVMRELVARYGVTGLWVGWVGVQWRQASWTAAYFGSLSFLRSTTDRAFERLAPASAVGVTQASQLVSGFAAGLFGACFNVPGDLIRTTVQRKALAGLADGSSAPLRPLPFFAVGEFLATGAHIADAFGARTLWTGFSWKAVHLGTTGALMAVLLPFWTSVFGAAAP